MKNNQFLANQNSRSHHWWPKTLRKHWADDSGVVWRIRDNGNIDCAVHDNKNHGAEPHGHTALQGDEFKTNFEPEFDQTDNSWPKGINLRKKYVHLVEGLPTTKQCSVDGYNSEETSTIL